MKDYTSMLKAKPKKSELSYKEKYEQLKKHTEDAGMQVKEVDGKIVVTRVKK
jgi:uncharacterized protein (DUF302 family)